MRLRSESNRLQTSVAQTLIAALLIIIVSSDVASAGIKQDSRPQSSPIVILVTDENGVSVASARVAIRRTESGYEEKRETDYSGRCEFPGLERGRYSVRIEKDGFYATETVLDLPESNAVTIEVTHQREFSDTMNVVYSPPAIDAGNTSSGELLTDREIINLPYPTTRDIRSLVRFLPGVVQDTAGNLHVNGAGADQLQSRLDGFNISHPASGLLDLRVSVDALRTVEVLSSRYSAEHGKASGGLINLETGMGDDRLRFSATNFIPSFQTTRGIALDNWTPRVTLSGPLRRKRAWFFEAADAEHNLDLVKELPAGEDRNHTRRLGNLLKAQVNLSQTNILTAGLVVNHFRADHIGLTQFSPIETTRQAERAAYLLTVKEQSYFANGWLLEIGAAINRFRVDEEPLGERPFVISPAGLSGNHFETSQNRSNRTQLVAALVLPALKRLGRHEVKTGVDLDLINFNQFSARRPFTILREDGTRSHLVSFDGPRRFARDNLESSWFVQDRWSSERVLIEAGLRLDRDTIIKKTLISPRLAGAYLPGKSGNLKLSGGIGIFRDVTNLELVVRPGFGRRFDTVFTENGTGVEQQTATVFLVNERALTAPRYLNWSLAVERVLPGSLHVNVEYIQKRGNDGFSFNGLDLPASAVARFQLGNDRRDRYDSLQVTIRKLTRGNYALLASYARSAARSNTLFDTSFETPVFEEAEGGPLPWDSPNRFVSWGWMPLVRGFNLAYSVEARDGYPFSVVDEDQRIVGRANANRFPFFFSLNLHTERRFRLGGFQWALRAGFNNVTNRRNPTAVNNNINSPDFLTFGGLQDRAFTGRIRFLGRK